jgi:hypothetical protein
MAARRGADGAGRAPYEDRPPPTRPDARPQKSIRDTRYIAPRGARRGPLSAVSTWCDARFVATVRITTLDKNGTMYCGIRTARAHHQPSAGRDRS